MNLYKSFVENFSHIQLLRQVGKVLKWDYRTYMPSGAIEIRSQQIAYMASLAHKEATSEIYQEALQQMVDIETGVVKIKGLNFFQEANLREWAKDFNRHIKLPLSFVKEYYRVITISSEIWKKARQLADFNMFRPWLEKVVTLNQEKARLLGYREHPYDALLELYEPEITSAIVCDLFSDLKPFLTGIVEQTNGESSPDEAHFINGFANEKKTFNQLLLETIGVNRENTRIHPSDVRLTTNLERGILQNIFSVFHESGHALYELGLPKEEWATPVGQFASVGLHESQSRWWEVIIGKSLPFWSYMYPKLQLHFPQLKGLSLSNFYQHINHIQPSFIRIYADEITYPLHIMVRFKLEKQLIEGSMGVADVPHLWNKEMKDLLGIVPDNDAEGCLQDIHWGAGLFGYFPTYALGSIYAVQYFETFTALFPDWEERVAKGSFAFISEWLRTNIHQFGRAYSAPQSIKRITGQPVSVQPYKKYLSQKYNTLSVLL